jgi:deoxyadenosine/deoxycytidine kinase
MLSTNNNNRLISIEGNIGSGKSTLLSNLKEHYKNNSSVVFLKEPVDEWEQIKDKDGLTMLQKFYADQEKYSFPFQMMAYISRLAILRKVVKENKNAVLITERSLYTDKLVFAKMLYEQGKIEDVNYQIYLHWFDEFASDCPVNNIIYVKTSPEKCYERIHKRARQGEEVIPLAYLTSCDEYHNNFLSDNTDPLKSIQCPKLVLDGNNDIFENKDILNDWISKIDKLITSADKKNN